MEKKGEDAQQDKKSWSPGVPRPTKKKKKTSMRPKKSEPQMLWKECSTLSEPHVQEPRMKQTKMHSRNQKIMDECGMRGAGERVTNDVAGKVGGCQTMKYKGF